MSLLTEQEITGCWMANANPEAYENYTLKEHILRSSKDVEAEVIKKIKAQGPVAHLYFNEHGTPRVDQQYLPSEDSFPVYRLPEGD